jgi:predicted chitinase
MSPTPVTDKENIKGNLADSFSLAAKNFLLLPGIARDLNEAVQSIIGIVKQKGGEAKEGVDEKFIAEQDYKAKEKLKAPTDVTEEKSTKKKGILGTLMDNILNPKKMIQNVMKGFKKLLSPKNIMKVLGKIALPALIISTLWVGISSGFEKWKETGSIWEAYKEAVGSIVEFLTFGLIDKETVKNLYQGVADFLMPVIKPIQEFFGKFSDWVGDKFNSVLKLFGIDIKPKEAPKETPQKEQVVTPDILKGKEPVREKDAQQKAADILSKPVTLPAEAPPPKPEVQPAAPTPTILAPGTASTPTPTPTKKAKAPGAKDAKAATIGSESGKKAVINEMNAKKIEDPTARASIMAQVAHESGGFTTLSENLNYKAPTLLKLFPKKFSGPDDAQQVASGGPEAVAERIYGGRMGNAPEGSGDGFEYRGRGFIQLTGKNNYKIFGYDSNPDDLTKPGGAAESAIKFMKGYKGDWSNITAVTKFVNGGTNGLADREEYFHSFLNDPTITKIDTIASTPSGGSVATASNEVSSGQRQQAKTQTPMIVNAPTTNNTKVVNNQSATMTKDKANPTNMVLARVA